MEVHLVISKAEHACRRVEAPEHAVWLVGCIRPAYVETHRDALLIREFVANPLIDVDE